MTTSARTRKTNNKRNITRIGTWNIQAWNDKDQEIITELKNNKIEICGLSETKRKGKGKVMIDDYIFIYSGVPKDKRAHSGVGLLIHKKYERLIEGENYINDRILQVTITLEGEKAHLISVYAPDMGKSKEQREGFYEELQTVVDAIRPNEKIMILGDLNARIGNEELRDITQRFNEEILNENGELLKSFCATNTIRINNTYFDHPMKYKYTWQNTRGQQSVLDYFMTNRSFMPGNILDVRTLNAANVGSDHKLVLCKLRLHIREPPKQQTHYVYKFNIESFENDSTKQLYINRMNDAIEQQPIRNEDNIEQQWETLKNNILKAANEAIGQRRTKINKTNKTPWFTPEIKELSIKKKKAYMRYIRQRTQENWITYTQERNTAKARIRAIKEQYWESFTKEMERDLYGGQKRVWKMLRRNKMEIKDTVQTNRITIEEWEDHFRDMYQDKEEEQTNIREDIIREEEIEITETTIRDTMRNLKHRKSPGPDNITNEMIKYGGETLYEELNKLFKNIAETGEIPGEWKTSTTIPIFKKGEKTKTENYRGITLLNSILKMFTKTILEEISKNIPIREEQQGFRKNRSTIDAIFIVKQIAEKALEFNKPAYMCFVDMTKAFDRVKLADVITILQEKETNSKWIHLIKNINQNCKTKIKVGYRYSAEININTGIRQGDSLSPFLFNLIMDRIIENLPRTEGYRMGETHFNVVAYADDAVLITDSEDKLQRLLHAFNQTAKKLNMIVNSEKTKCMVIAKEPERCKLELDGKIVEQVMKIKYLGSNITSDGKLQSEVVEQTMKAARISGCLKDIVWKNKYLNTESKIKIYKTAIRPVMTYAAETRPDTTKSMHIMNTTEMRILRTIYGKTIRDRVRNDDLRQQSGIEEVTKLIRKRRKCWKKHIERMNEDRLVKKAQTQIPVGRRSQGRPLKRWKECWTSSSPEA